MPGFVITALEVLTLMVDGIGYAILFITAVKFIIRYVAFETQRLKGIECAQRFREIRLDLLSHIILAIDFMVISDVIHSGIVETRESLITLGIFVLIRSVLAYFLGLDMKDLKAEEAEARQSSVTA